MLPPNTDEDFSVALGWICALAAVVFMCLWGGWL